MALWCIFAPLKNESGVLSGVGWDCVFGQGEFWLCFWLLESRFLVWLSGGAAGKLLPNSSGWCRPKWGEGERRTGGRKMDVNREKVAGHKSQM